MVTMIFAVIATDFMAVAFVAIAIMFLAIKLWPCFVLYIYTWLHHKCFCLSI